jgi:hypothetical protein
LGVLQEGGFFFFLYLTDLDRKSPSLGSHAVGFDDVSFFPVMEGIETHATFIAGVDLFGIFSHPFEGREYAFVDDIAFA